MMSFASFVPISHTFAGGSKALSARRACNCVSGGCDAGISQTRKRAHGDQSRILRLSVLPHEYAPRWLVGAARMEDGACPVGNRDLATIRSRSRRLGGA